MSAKYDYIEVRLTRDDFDRKVEESDDSDYEIERQVVVRRLPTPPPEKEPTPTPLPQKTPTPVPESISDSRVTLNVTDRGDVKKLKLQRTNVVSIINDLIYLLEDSAQSSDIRVILKRKNNGGDIPSKIKPDYVFRLHSLVLSARSRWCKSVLEKRENTHGRFEKSPIKYNYSYDDIDGHELVLENVNVDDFQDFVKFLYIAQCNVNDYNHIGLVYLARAFGIKCLEDLTCRYIAKRLDVIANSKGCKFNELIYLASIAYDFNLEAYDIKTTCVDLLSRFRKELVQTEAWDNFSVQYPKIVSDMLAR